MDPVRLNIGSNKQKQFFPKDKKVANTPWNYFLQKYRIEVISRNEERTNAKKTDRIK